MTPSKKWDSNWQQLKLAKGSIKAKSLKFAQAIFEKLPQYQSAKKYLKFSELRRLQLKTFKKTRTLYYQKFDEVAQCRKISKGFRVLSRSAPFGLVEIVVFVTADKNTPNENGITLLHYQVSIQPSMCNKKHAIILVGSFCS